MSTPGRYPIGQNVSHIPDHLANERTFLAWVRTGVAVAGLGFVVARFGLDGGLPATVHSAQLTEWIGVLLLLLGPAIVTLAALHFFRTERDIDAGVYRTRYGLVWAVGGGSVVLGIALAGYLVLVAR